MGRTAKPRTQLDPKQWFVWQLSDGDQVELTGDVLKHWNEKGRQWAREQLQLPEVGGKPPYEVMKKWNEEAMAWFRRRSARYGNKLTACRYLAFLENPGDRPLLEYALSSTERNQNWDMELRITADRALAIHDGVAEDVKSLRRNPLEDDPKHYLLGGDRAGDPVAGAACGEGASLPDVHVARNSESADMANDCREPRIDRSNRRTR